MTININSLLGCGSMGGMIGWKFDSCERNEESQNNRAAINSLLLNESSCHQSCSDKTLDRELVQILI